MCEIKRLRDMEPGDRFLCTLPNLLGECELVYHHAGQLSYVSLIGSEGVTLICSNTPVVVCTERDELERVKADTDTYQAGVKSLTKFHKASQDQLRQQTN